MKKKLVSMLLCAAMTVAMVSGCGSKTEDAAPEAADRRKRLRQMQSRHRRRQPGIPQKERHTGSDFPRGP